MSQNKYTVNGGTGTDKFTPDGTILHGTEEIPLDEMDGDDKHTHDQVPTTADRQQWDKPIEFLLSCIAMSVGLGNIWRFPYTAFRNGGGAFLIPYVIVLFFVGKPLYFLELSVGQFCSKGSARVWQMAPFFKGVGYGATFGSACVLSFYCALMSITVFYFVQSFSKTLPWNVCNENWNRTIANLTCVSGSAVVISEGGNTTAYNIPDLYFRIDVYNAKDQIDDGIGTPDLKLSLALLFCWIAILVSLIKGVQSAGKVAYFTALFPYVVLIIFLIGALTLEGAWDGVIYFLNPQWEKLLSPTVWVEAVTQCFFSISVAFGPVITFASYNKFSHNIYKDAMIVSMMDTFTSLLAGLTTFSVLGNLAYKTNKRVDEVVTGGPGLAFVSYPAAIANFPVSQLFSVMFFLMLFTLGIGSATSLAGGIITVIHDKFANIDKKVITVGVCVIGFFAGLIYVTPGGLWMIDLVDYFGAGSVLYILAILELIGIIFVYGLPNIVRDIQFMLGRKISLYWQVCWVLTPIVLFVVFLFNVINGEGVRHNGKYFPSIALVFGWLLVSTAVLMLPIMAFHGIFQQESEKGFLDKVKKSLKPLKEWGPLNLADRRRWQAHKDVQARRPSLAGKFFIKN